MSTWVCVNCGGRRLHHQGVARHRQMHREAGDLLVMRKPGWELTYDYRSTEEAPDE